MTPVEIIDETVKYYSEDTRRRATNGKGCDYLTEDGRMCAVGRCLTDYGLKRFGNDSGYFYADMIEHMEPKYKSVSDEFFWLDLQSLHDRSEYWDEFGLTDIGQKRVEELRKRYE